MTSQDTYEPPYRTSDFYLVAFLRCSRVQMTGIVKEGKRLLFDFPRSPKLQEALKGWDDGTAEVPAYDYAVQIRKLKSYAYRESILPDDDDLPPTRVERRR